MEGRTQVRAPGRAGQKGLGRPGSWGPTLKMFLHGHGAVGEAVARTASQAAADVVE